MMLKWLSVPDSSYLFFKPRPQDMPPPKLSAAMIMNSVEQRKIYLCKVFIMS